MFIIYYYVCIIVITSVGVQVDQRSRPKVRPNVRQSNKYTYIYSKRIKREKKKETDKERESTILTMAASPYNGKIAL